MGKGRTSCALPRQCARCRPRSPSSSGADRCPSGDRDQPDVIGACQHELGRRLRAVL